MQALQGGAVSKEYTDYLNEHIGAVQKAARWMVDNVPIVKALPYDERMRLLDNALAHDESKYQACEYMPYDNYFYGEKDEEAFNRAWLHHIHNNPHHWQHWVLVNDDGAIGDAGKVVALEMPTLYALEMVADWWSFSWRTGNLEEVFDWYEEHRDSIILHPKTREFVEAVLDEICGKLPARVSE